MDNFYNFHNQLNSNQKVDQKLDQSPQLEKQHCEISKITKFGHTML